MIQNSILSNDNKHTPNLSTKNNYRRRRDGYGEKRINEDFNQQNSYNNDDDQQSIRTYSFDEEDYKFLQPEEKFKLLNESALALVKSTLTNIFVEEFASLARRYFGLLPNRLLNSFIILLDPAEERRGRSSDIFSFPFHKPGRRRALFVSKFPPPFRNRKIKTFLSLLATTKIERMNFLHLLPVHILYYESLSCSSKTLTEKNLCARCSRTVLLAWLEAA